MSVTLLVHTAVVGFVIRTAVSVPADMVSEDGNVISALLVTMVSLTVSVSVSKGVRVGVSSSILIAPVGA